MRGFWNRKSSNGEFEPFPSLVRGAQEPQGERATFAGYSEPITGLLMQPASRGAQDGACGRGRITVEVAPDGMVLISRFAPGVWARPVYVCETIPAIYLRACVPNAGAWVRVLLGMDGL